MAAKKALATRENQGNLAPVENGGRFLSGAIMALMHKGGKQTTYGAYSRFDLIKRGARETPVLS
jgi:hypothetical protein